MKIKHFSHEEHPLVLIDEMQVDVEGEKFECHGCKEAVSSGSTMYSCSKCKVFLHKSCAELPIEITHPMHSQHPLQLLAKPSYKGGECICNICQRDWNGFTYHCKTCEFDVDIMCSQLASTLEHPSHPHLLKIQPRSVLFKCDACGVEKKDESYDCTVCQFWIHKTCGSMTNNYLSLNVHPHPLTLAYSFPQEYKRYGLKCDICHYKLHPSTWVYYCALCRYFIHLNCMTSYKPNLINEEISPDVIRVPAQNLSSVLIRHFLEQNNLPLVELSPELEHFSHKHPLILSNVQDESYELMEDDHETVCNGCVEPISGSCYTCAQCNYFIHEDCARLPKDLSSYFHPQHRLSFYFNLDKFLSPFRCSSCDIGCNGFMYACFDCEFALDLRCALLPSTIKYEDHQHILVRGESASEEVCDACTIIEKGIFYHCKTCPKNLKFKLGMRCAMLPKNVGHRSDTHPLILSFPPFDYHPNKITCDMCEKECHPKYRIYHCRECNHSFHANCIPRIGISRNTKFGAEIQIDSHSHPLKFTRKVKHNFCCDKCDVDMKGKTAFVCETCSFTICCQCASKIVSSSDGDDTTQ